MLLSFFKGHIKFCVACGYNASCCCIDRALVLMDWMHVGGFTFEQNTLVGWLDTNFTNSCGAIFVCVRKANNLLKDTEELHFNAPQSLQLQ